MNNFKRALCFLGLHKWRKAGPDKPIHVESQFASDRYIGHHALGQCERCRKVALRRYESRYAWGVIDEMTKARYMDKYNQPDSIAEWLEE